MKVREPLRGPVRREPHPALRGLVADYHGYFHDGMVAGVHHGLPSATLTMLFAFDEPVDVGWQADPGSRARHWAMVSGLHAGPALVHHDGFQHGVQLALTPRGARVLLGVPAGALAGALLPLAESRVYDAMAAATTWPERFDVLDRWLLDRAASSEPTWIRGELAHVWRRIGQSHGSVRVAELADEIGWSRRHLTESFTAEYGLAPKQAARIARFQLARAELASDAAIADVAVACGYADQAHLTRDFRDLGGCTPTSWRREQLSFVQDGAVAG